MIHEFTIKIPSDSSGYIGRTCKSELCGRYFKVLVAEHSEKLYCPYCRLEFTKLELLTDDQKSFVLDSAKEEARLIAATELQNMLKSVFGTRGGSGAMTYTPARISRREIVPGYSEKDVDTEIECPGCNIKFQVFGIFGYCPGCGKENTQIVDRTWEEIAPIIDATSDSKEVKRTLRLVYIDTVSLFEAKCKKISERISTETCNFQDIFEARRHFKRIAQIDILDGTSVDDQLLLRRVFNKRHSLIHHEGVITERYARNVPEDAHLLNSKVSLDVNEVGSVIFLLKKILLRLSTS